MSVKNSLKLLSRSQISSTTCTKLESFWVTSSYIRLETEREGNTATLLPCSTVIGVMMALPFLFLLRTFMCTSHRYILSGWHADADKSSWKSQRMYFNCMIFIFYIRYLRQRGQAVTVGILINKLIRNWLKAGTRETVQGEKSFAQECGPEFRFPRT